MKPLVGENPIAQGLVAWGKKLTLFSSTQTNLIKRKRIETGGGGWETMNRIKGAIILR